MTIISNEIIGNSMAKASETKVTRRDAILTTGKAAVALGAAALFAGRLPRIQPLDGEGVDAEDDDMDEQQQPAGGLATAAVQYNGTDDDEPFDGIDTEDPLVDTDETAGVSSHLVELGLVPIQFVISEIDTNPLNPTFGGTPISNRNTVSVMTVNKHHHVHVWEDQQGAQAILPASTGPKIVVGTSVDVEALEDAIRGPPLGLLGVKLNGSGHTYLILAFGSPFTAAAQDDDNDQELPGDGD